MHADNVERCFTLTVPPPPRPLTFLWSELVTDSSISA
jgi:hypothetical protein